MKLRLDRIFLKPDYTIGKLYIDEEYFCDTLEDTYRNLSNLSQESKVYGSTAIPNGLYKIILSISKRFKKILPEILDVPNFDGIRIHSGNTAKDTEGCILVGRNKFRGMLIESRITLDSLMNKLQDQDDITIEVNIIRDTEEL